MAQLDWNEGEAPPGRAWDANGLEILDRVLMMDTVTGEALCFTSGPDGKHVWDETGEGLVTHRCCYAAPVFFRPYTKLELAQKGINNAESPPGDDPKQK